MTTLVKGRYSADLLSCRDDLLAVQKLRARAFGLSVVHDMDAYDPICRHIVVRDIRSCKIVCCLRIMLLTPATVSASYSAQYYELSALEGYDGRMAEIGRFCIDPDVNDPDIVRIAWGAVTRFVDSENIDLLFGCSSFSGVDASEYLDAFAVLKERHLAPKRWLPRVKAPNVFEFAARLTRRPNMRNAMRHMPPLLRSYLLLGGWVSDHAVVDHHMNTLHVFTGVEIKSIPDARKRLLRAVAN